MIKEDAMVLLCEHFSEGLVRTIVDALNTEWIGLTENQIDKLEKEFIGFPVPNIYSFAKAIEAKLKEKNT
jgi:hypothetical protein